MSDSESLPRRKTRHLNICLDEFSPVETGSSRLDEIALPHCAIPRSAPGDLHLGTRFLGYDLAMPVMISCMTGGSEEGRRLNRLLAEAAGRRRLVFGLGSIRVMFRYPETRAHFTMRSLVPDSPILANIGAAQLAEYSAERLVEAVRSLEADGLYVHLNAAQELFQEGGDTDFSHWRDNLRRLIEEAPIPILVKETGAGIGPREGLELLRWGAAYVDLAGAGGTDWVAVESIREGKLDGQGEGAGGREGAGDGEGAEGAGDLMFGGAAVRDGFSPVGAGGTVPRRDGFGVRDESLAGAGGTVSRRERSGVRDESLAGSFLNWGYSTAELLLAYRLLAGVRGETGDLVRGRIIASGGLRRPGDYVVGIAGGAYLAGAALPFIRRASSGPKAVHNYIDDIDTALRRAILLSGVDSLEAFRHLRLRVKPDLEYNARVLAESAGARIQDV